MFMSYMYLFIPHLEGMLSILMKLYIFSVTDKWTLFPKIALTHLSDMHILEYWNKT